tara:strand:- start:252 stop:455 length:204 start_codon:yes stop_codon:yes gene_type:complete
MKELDLVMSAYLDNEYETASLIEQAHFKALLELPDPDLYGLLLGRSQSADAQLQAFSQRLRLRMARN